MFKYEGVCFLKIIVVINNYCMLQSIHEEVIIMNNIENTNQLREIIRILERKLGILNESEFSCCSITMAQCHALVEIGRAKEISLNELAELLNLEKSTMSRTVNNLVAGEVAERIINAQDRRYVNISLTEKGYKLYEDIEKSMNLYFAKIYDSIPQNKRSQVLESLNILINAFTQNES